MQRGKRIFRLIIFSMISMVPSVILAQTINGGLCGPGCSPNSYWEAGINLGVSAYTGHINRENPDAIANPWHNAPDPTIGGFLQYHLNQNWGVEFGFFTTRLTGKWNTKYPYPPQYKPNVFLAPPPRFKTGLTAYSLSFVSYINRLFMSPQANPRMDVYIKAGIGQVALNPIEFIQNMGSSDNHRRTLFPAALGTIWHLTSGWNIGLAAQWNLVNSDRLDTVQDAYVDPNTGQIVHGYYNALEHFGAVTLNISYRFGNKQFWKY